MAVGSTLGGWIPSLWGAGFFSFSGLILSSLGAIAGIYIGFKMSQIDDGSIYQKAGVVDGDIITAVNGQELNSVAGSITLLKTLKGADHVEIDIRRGGQTVKVAVDVH